MRRFLSSSIPTLISPVHFLLWWRLGYQELRDALTFLPHHPPASIFFLLSPLLSNQFPEFLCLIFLFVPGQIPTLNESSFSLILPLPQNRWIRMENNIPVLTSFDFLNFTFITIEWNWKHITAKQCYCVSLINSACLFFFKLKDPLIRFSLFTLPPALLIFMWSSSLLLLVFYHKKNQKKLYPFP